MNERDTQIRKLVNLTIDKSITWMKEALTSDESALKFRDWILETYDTVGETRVELFKDFYFTFAPTFGLYIEEEEMSGSDDYWLGDIEGTAFESINKFTTEEKYAIYEDLQDKLYNKLCDIKDPGYYYDMYEVLFTKFHADFFFFTALIVLKELSA